MLPSRSPSRDPYRHRILGDGAAALGRAAVYFCHAPLAYIGSARFGAALPVALLCAVVASALLGRRLATSRAPLVGAFGMLYYLGVVAGLVLPLYFLVLIAPLYVPVPLVLALAAAWSVQRSRRRAALALALVNAAALVTALPLGPLPLALLAGLLGCWSLLLVTREWSALPRPAAFFAAFGLLVSLRLAAFLSGEPAGEAAAVARQPGVRVVVAPRDLDPAPRWYRRAPEVRFAIERCDGRALYVGTRGRGPGLFEVGLETGARRFLPMPGDASDNLAQDCTAGRLFVGSYGAGQVYEVDAASLAVTRTLALPGVKVGIFHLPADARLLYMIPDASSKLFLLDPARLESLGHIEGPHWNAAMILDEPRGRVVKMSNAGRIQLYDRFSLALLAEKTLPGRLYFNVAAADARGELLVGNMASGRVFALDAETLAVRRKGRHDRGIRFMRYDPRRDLLYVANFFTGDLVALSPDDFAERGRLHVGPRPRWIEPSPDGDRLWVASGAGAVEIDLRAWPGPTDMAQAPPAACVN